MSPRIFHALVLVSASVMGCSKGPRGVGEGDGGSGAPAVLADDRVVIESAMATFVEGVVASVSRDRARVQFGAGAEVSDRPLTDLYIPSSNEVPPLLEGNFAVCHMPDGTWKGCRIESLNAKMRVADDETATFDL